MSRAGIESGRTLLANFLESMRLNYGDCMTYATARIADEPLLFIGNDVARTDIAAA